MEAGRIRALLRDCTAGSQTGVPGGPGEEQAERDKAGNFILGALGSRGRFKQERGLPWMVLQESHRTHREVAWGPVWNQKGDSGGLPHGGDSGERSAGVLEAASSFPGAGMLGPGQE